MRIHAVSEQRTDDHIEVSAEVDYGGQSTQRLFFRLDSAYHDYIIPDATPFVTATLLSAMRRHENVEVEGLISRQLHEQLERVMHLVQSWNIRCDAVDVRPRAIHPLNGNGRAVGCFFTGGVDSFYTLLKYRHSITHLIFLRGCDIPINNQELYEEALRHILLVADQLGMKVITVASNFRDIIEPHIEWEYNLGSALAAVGQLLRGGFMTIYIPSGMRWDTAAPYGSHPALDPLWSVEGLNLVHDGSEYSRLEKVLYTVGKSDLALEHLRVCCQLIKGKYNCGECMKCIQTKLELLCAGSFERAKTLDQIIDLQKIERTYYDTTLGFNTFAEDVLQYMQNHQMYPEICEELSKSLGASEHPSLLRRAAGMIAYLDKTFNHRRFYSYIFSQNEHHDRRWIFKMFSRMGLIR